MKNLIKGLGIIAMVVVISFVIISCATSMSAQKVNKTLPTLTKSKFVSREQAEQDINANLCIFLAKDQIYATEGITVKGVLEYGAKGIDEMVLKYGGNAYILNRFEWVPVQTGLLFLYGIQLYLQFDILLYGSDIQSKQRIEQVQEIARKKAEQEQEQAQEQARKKAEQEQAKKAEQTRLANLYRQAGNNVGNLPNTSRTWRHSADARIYCRYNFGNGNYLYESNFNLFGTVETTSGTFRVNGDTVIFLTSEGEYYYGTIIGNIITISGTVYR